MLGSKKLLMIFDTRRSMEEVAGLAFMLNHFIKVRPWTTSEANRSRRVWLKGIGRPLHAWSRENMARIGRIWGPVIYVEDTQDQQYSAFKVMVDIGLGPNIQAMLKVIVEGEEFLIYVKETSGD
ncbi:hypothetical protein PIB30_029403 [Stylosanthes scabra]|uniref:DUF4283 domain-containing protein n=1 Tax=Stylosanthes scabra TaxID=79078 RepID=A0ABU6VA57_9FABA|nr:hypothetical protein [Stylosanthes scabra]